jgi:hypothetical protein
VLRVSNLYSLENHVLRDLWLCDRWCRVQQLQTKNRGALSEAGLLHLGTPGTLLKVVDAMSTLPGLSSSGEVLCISFFVVKLTFMARMFCVQAKTVLSFTCARKRKRTWKIRKRSWPDLTTIHGRSICCVEFC